jgi:hypothetical protein
MNSMSHGNMSSVRYVARVVKQASSSNENAWEISIHAITIHTANIRRRLVLSALVDFYTTPRTRAHISVLVKAAISTHRFVHVAKMAIWLKERNTPNS